RGRWQHLATGAWARAAAAHRCVPAPQVHLQTQQEVRMRMTGMALQVVRSDGVLALYNGLSASLCRQVPPAVPVLVPAPTCRAAQAGRGGGWLQPPEQPWPLASARVSGLVLGNPLPTPQGASREPVLCPGSYAHALDGLYRVAREEGLRKLFSGATMASSRGMLVTVGQLSCYDQAKQLVLGTGYLSDGIVTHFIASFIAGGCATVLCQPLDVLKTRLMNSKGEYQGVLHCTMETAKLGPLAFYKVRGRGCAPSRVLAIKDSELPLVCGSLCPGHPLVCGHLAVRGQEDSLHPPRRAGLTGARAEAQPCLVP
ncbi:PREDICTED: mitochondrial dicarboxylate carrier, partial [Myotis davidii]|uniref:mitochondrial dicarboxylate carrier n=1 Tax=Myotis davidii TaxID=225400 RepID=UPI0007674D28